MHRLEMEMIAWVSEMLTNGKTHRVLPKGWHTPTVRTIGTANAERREVTVIHVVDGLKKWYAPTLAAERCARMAKSPAACAPRESRQTRGAHASCFVRGLRTY